jgi:hypothetical protein
MRFCVAKWCRSAPSSANLSGKQDACCATIGVEKGSYDYFANEGEVSTAYAMGIMIDGVRAKGSLTVPKVPNTMGCDTYVVP